MLGEQQLWSNASFGVSVTGYHVYNGIFAEKLFTDEVSLSNQTITYCGVGAHHQNGFVENHIGRLTRGARTLLLSAQRRWPEAIGEILWPFAWKDYERCYNELSISKDGLTPIENFLKLGESLLSVTTILGVAQFMFLLKNYKVLVLNNPSGILGLGWAFILVDHPVMLAMLLWC